MHGAELGQPHGQLAIAARHRLIDLAVMRAVHRLEDVSLAVGVLDRLEHAFLVVRKSGRRFDRGRPCRCSGCRRDRSRGHQLVANEVFELLTDLEPLGIHITSPAPTVWLMVKDAASCRARGGRGSWLLRCARDRVLVLLVEEGGPIDALGAAELFSSPFSTRQRC